MDDLVYVLDKNNIFVDIYTPDKTHKYLPGPEDCLGRAMHDTMPPDLASAFSKYIDAARSKRRAMDYIFFIDKYGKRKWFSSRFTARRGNDSEYLGTTVVIRDITESQQFKEELIASENKFRTVVNQLVDGLLVFNTQGKIVDTNPALGKILRVAANKLLNKDIWDILSLVKFVPADYELSSEQLKTFFIDYRAHSRSTKQLMQFDLHLKDDKNKDLFLKLFLFPFETNSDFLFAAILRDVSKRVLVEQEIKSLNMELENRVKERTAQLEEAFQDLRLEILRREGIESDLIATKEDLAKALNTERDLNEIKNKFITMISHQYRTPITVISSSLELMNEHFKKGNQERFDKHSQKIKKAINTLIQLLENVTAFQSSNDGKLSAILIELNLEKILWKIIDEITIYDNDSHRLTFVYDSKDTVVKSDPKLLYMIFNNLLLNSLKFSPANTEIKILVSSDSKYYFIEIEDKGIGISEQELQVIFDPFIRSEKVSPTMGSGLGLTIVQRCLDLLGGRIKIQSEPNKYTKVLVRLNK
jgi:PAS domain S-box-containing protein